MKLTDLRPGDQIKGFAGFGCIPDGAIRTVLQCDDGLYVRCQEGKHFLDGQEDDNGVLVGLSLVKEPHL